MRQLAVLASLACVGYLSGEVTTYAGEVTCADLVRDLMVAAKGEPLAQSARLLVKRLCEGIEVGATSWRHFELSGMGVEMWRELNRSTIEYLTLPRVQDIGGEGITQLLREWMATKSRRVRKLLSGHLHAYGPATSRLRAELDDRAVALLRPTEPSSLALPVHIASRLAELEADGWTLVPPTRVQTSLCHECSKTVCTHVSYGTGRYLTS